MKRIILTVFGLVIFATPLAAENPHANSYAPHQLHRFGIERNSTSAQAQVRAPERLIFAPVGSRSFGLALQRGPVGSQSSSPHITRPYGGHGVPFSTPPQGWSDRR
jgi:hypothetical protein